MGIDWFFCITLSIILLRHHWKHRPRPERPVQQKVLPPTRIDATALQRQRDVEDLKRQGYSDEVITVILPTINGG